MIEIRQDQLRTSAGVCAWAERLAAAYRQIDAALPERFGVSFQA
jgi:predicted N-formylglutamate amidohydrolase